MCSDLFVTLQMPFTPGLTCCHLTVRGWPGSQASSLTRGQELMRGAELLELRQNRVRLIVLPWLLTSLLTSTGHFSSVCGEPRLLGLPAIGGALAGHWEPASQRARHNLHSGRFLTSVHWQSAFLPASCVCLSTHLVAALQSFTVCWVLDWALEIRRGRNQGLFFLALSVPLERCGPRGI